MRIAINCRFLIKDRLEGIGNYSYETISRLVASRPDDEFVLIFDRPYDEAFVFGDNCIPVVVSPPARHPWLWYTWFEWRIPYILKKYKAEVFYSPDSYLSMRSSVPTVLIVHDLAFLHYPRFIPTTVRRYYKKWFPRFLKKATQIGTVSHATATDVEEQYPNLSLSEKTRYTPCAADEGFYPREYSEKEEIRKTYTEGHEYLLFVGAIHPRKNVINLLKAFYKFKKFYRTDMRLVLVGRIAWMSDEFETYLDEHPYREDIIHLQDQDKKALSELYAAAYALVYPSYFEGFGMPVLESLQSGVPVIVSNVSSMPEVAGSAGLLVDPSSPDDICDKMGILYKDEQVYQELAEHCASQSAKFSWENTTATIAEMIDNANAKGT